MRIWVITSRAFRGEEYFPRLEETRVAKTGEEAREIFNRECHSQGDWFWDGGVYGREYVDSDTYVLTSDEAVCVVTLREVELPE